MGVSVHTYTHEYYRFPDISSKRQTSRHTGFPKGGTLRWGVGYVKYKLLLECFSGLFNLPDLVVYSSSLVAVVVNRSR